MRTFFPSKLKVNLLAPATANRPFEGRKYTLTHSDQTGDLFLSIGTVYNWAVINPSFRDEVIAEWIPQMGEFTLYGKVYISGGEYDEAYARLRFLIFKKELELALKAIIYGDQTFFTFFPWLLDAPIYIQFESVYPEFHQVLFYGTPRYYLTKAIQDAVSQSSLI
ncbi:MAG: staygreen family protein [Bacillota bacterium]|nr:staygreen family protein [Bacillota bacterium]